MGQSEHLRRVLLEIAAKANNALLHSHGSGASEPYEPDDYTSGPDASDAVCTPLTVPDDFIATALRASSTMNAGNVPFHLQDVVEDAIANQVPLPPSITLSVKRYWGPASRVLPVSFLDSPDNATKNHILKYMNYWTKTGGISFKITNGIGTIRITRSQRGYSSYMGTDNLLIPKSQATMILQGFTSRSSDSESNRVICHEAGHALGFEHEHLRSELVSRIDRNKAYAYFGGPPNNWPRATVDFNVLTPLDARTIMGTPVDQDSIMCYQLPGAITRDGQPIRGGNRINDSDYRFIGRIYPKSGAVPNLSGAPYMTPAAPAAAPDHDTDEFEVSEEDFQKFGR